MEDNEPRELSAKINICSSRPAFKVRKRARDPRFDDRCGKFSAKIFEQNYGFVDELRDGEINVVEKQIRKTKKSDDAEQLMKLHHSLVQKKLRRKEQKTKHENIEYIKQKRNEAPSEANPRPIFEKGLMKKIELVRKYKELKQSGRLTAFMRRKRKQINLSNKSISK